MRSIKDIREALGMDQVSFGNAIGVSGASVSRMESGKSSPKLVSLVPLLDCGVNVFNYLFNLTDSMFFFDKKIVISNVFRLKGGKFV